MFNLIEQKGAYVFLLLSLMATFLASSMEDMFNYQAHSPVLILSHRQDSATFLEELQQLVVFRVTSVADVDVFGTAQRYAFLDVGSNVWGERLWRGV